MKLITIVTILLLTSIECRSQNDFIHIREFEKIEGDQISFTGTYKDSLVWQLLASSRNKFKIKKELVQVPGTYQNSPTISQFGFVGSIETSGNYYVLTFNFPDTDMRLLEKVFHKNDDGVRIIDDKTVLLSKKLQTLWIYDTVCNNDKVKR